MNTALAEQLFTSRTNLLVELQRAHANPDLCDELATVLQLHVLGMHTADAEVRPHLRVVEKYRMRSEWNRLSAGRAADLIAHLAALPSPDDATIVNDGAACDSRCRLDLLIVVAQLALVRGDARPSDAQIHIRDIVEDLLSNSAEAILADQVVRDASTDAWWSGADVADLERLRRAVRPLVGDATELSVG
ncbi:hypothetical protein HH308_10040 [Gordonia sp. TBRC 11910]|uniref:Uncharacterized protein n=1 Tax=Gordonia asplenii TaxID=2725283 RepID=A0A848KTG5_9ACTN|nr:hypothetical protein [Gordonia asplenii]NMO01552.1 hypothetical protein [Gordonia asplenii]